MVRTSSHDAVLDARIRRAHGLVTITLRGDLDGGTAQGLLDAVSAGTRLSHLTLVVDVIGLSFVDAAGRRALHLAAAIYAATTGEELTIIGGPALRGFDERLAKARLAHPSGATATLAA
jgi:hypothetical protein